MFKFFVVCKIFFIFKLPLDENKKNGSFDDMKMDTDESLKSSQQSEIDDDEG